VQAILLHQLWHIINEVQTQTVFELSDRDLVEQLVSLVDRKQPLSIEENNLVRAYLDTKLPLIRDLADARLWNF
jgi:hypothetical protein